MKYRNLGKTGLQVSEISLGCEGFVDHDGTLTPLLLDKAEDLQINYLDFYTPDPNLRNRLGKALAGRRDKFILQAHVCTTWKTDQYQRTRKIEEVKGSFEDLLARLETDYIEVGMIHYVDSMEDWQEVSQGPVMEYAKELKAAGKIRHIGMSSHNPLVSKAAVESGLIEVLMFSINPCYDLQPASEDCNDLWDDKNYQSQHINIDPDRESLYELCEQKGVGITVMKAFGGGDLLDASMSPAGVALTVNQCIHYALTRPAVATVLSGAHTLKELEISAAYETAAEKEKDYAAAFALMPNISWEGHCMYCGHCAPCPVGIDVASVTKFLNLTKAQGTVPETVREHYSALEQVASECTGCGACEKRCPFGVKIIDNMKEAVTVFGK